MKGNERLQAVDGSAPRMAKALPELPMNGTVMVRLIRIAAFGMGNFFEPLFRRLDLSENSFHALCLLVAADDGTTSPSELSEMVGTSRANMTRLLKELEADGLITRAVATRDGRRQVVAITPIGRAKVEDTVPLIAEPLRMAFSTLNDGEMTLLETLLRKLIVSFDQNSHSPRHSLISGNDESPSIRSKNSRGTENG